MAELTTLARPYAKAAFEFAREHRALDGWSQALAALAAITADARVESRLSDPGHTAAEQAELVIELAGDALDDASRNYVRNLANYKRLSLLPEIARLFEDFKSQLEKSVDVQVISAQPIDDAQQANLSAALARYLDREVTLQASVDSSLIGGAIVRAGDMVIDGSIRGGLKRLAEATNS